MEISGLLKLYEDSIKLNWTLPALTDYLKKDSYTYGGMASEIEKLHCLFKELGIEKGDRIAVCGRNNPRWCISFLATITYGATIVPILQDFNANDIQHIINHSETKLLFVNDHIADYVDLENFCPNVIASFSLTDFKPIYAKEKSLMDKISLDNVKRLFDEKWPNGFTSADVSYNEVPWEHLTVLNYTSGTTGFTKGVMLPARSLYGNVLFGHSIKAHWRGSNALSFLPLAHVFGCAFDFLYPLTVGAHVTLLGKLPSPKILVEALQATKPSVIFTVPMVIEKIYRKIIVPLIEKKSMKIAMRFPFVESQINEIIRKRMVKLFGGEFYQMIIGGAALSGDVEAFLKKIKFPFTVGYGMTECGPLIAYADRKEFTQTSCGKALSTLNVRIDSTDPKNIPGEIQVDGSHVMLGYYKNPESTNAVFTEDGWLKTGDMATMDEDRTLYIKGRIKTMILSSSGQNIYPEEIESKLNSLPHVCESLVIEKEGKIVAMVYPDYDPTVKDPSIADNITIQDIMAENLKTLNKMVAPYEKVSEIIITPNEFAKTPKKSIKRYLYSSNVTAVTENK